MDFAKRYLVRPENFRLSDAPTSDPSAIDATEARTIRADDIETISDLQERLYAEGKRSLLIVLQALDAAGKDSTVEHVMKGVNPQGVRVVSFKEPSHLELAHDFLWRCQRALPSAGEIGIFNRSHYEDVLVARVHPELLMTRGLDPEVGEDAAFWEQRLGAISDWERHLAQSGTEIVKFFLHVSRDEQRERLLARASRGKKRWKFSAGDVTERAFYGDYQHAYERTLLATSREHAPWYVIPADQKWLMRTAVASIVRTTLQGMDPQWPVLSAAEQQGMDEAVRKLKADG